MTREQMLVNALKEYENNHYMDNGTSWQRTINQLIVDAEDMAKRKKKGEMSKERIKKLLNNAIGYCEDLLMDEYAMTQVEAKAYANKELGMTEEEYNEIMGE